MKYNFDVMVDRSTYSDSKYNYIKKADTVYEYPLPFSTADMDLACSKGIQDALQKVVEKNVYGYAILFGDNGREFNDAVKGWFKRRQDLDLKDENIFIAEGSLDGVQKALHAFTKPGDGVIIHKPGYGPFEVYAIEPTGRKVVKSHLLCDENGYYTIDFEDLEEKAKDPANTALLLCSPHNPVGRVWTEEELLKMHDICQRNGLILISDEVHADFLREGVKFNSVMKITGGKGVVTCTGLGKTFNLAQLRPGLTLITDEELLPKFKEMNFMTQINDFKMSAMIAACRDSDEWVEQVTEYINGNIDAAREFLAQRMPKVKCAKPEGTYLLWMDFSGYGLSDEEVHRRIYEKAWVILEDGEMFEEKRPGWQRMTMTAPRYRILEAFERIAKEFEE